MDDTKGYGPDVIRSVAPWILNVYSQNQRVLEGGMRTRAPLPSGPQQAGIETCVVAAGRGGIRHVQATPVPGPPGGAANSRNLALWEPGGIDFDAVFRGLHEIGYTGYFTVHSRTSQGIPPLDLATRSFEFLKPYCDGVQG
jgi:hypothetical protein